MVGNGTRQGARPESGLALVIGGSAGIGLALASEMAKRGLDIAIVGRDPERLAAACRSIAEMFRVTVTPVQLDAAAHDAPARLADALDRLGRPLHTAVIGIGRWQDGPIDAMTPDQFAALLVANVGTHQALAQQVLPRLAPDGGLLFVGSLAGTVPLPWIGAYAASKAALHSMALALRQEITSPGVRISVLAPGVVDTGFLPTPESAVYRRLLALIASRPETVARAGYLGLHAGVPLIVPGLLWRMLWLGSHIVPSALRSRILRSGLGPLSRPAPGYGRSGA